MAGLVVRKNTLSSTSLRNWNDGMLDCRDIGLGKLRERGNGKIGY